MRKSMWRLGACLLAILLLTASVYAAPPAQEPESGAAASPDTPLKASVSGSVINWGYRSEPDLHVTLTGAGWQAENITSSNGRFTFDALGDGVAVLNAVFPADSGLKAMTTDLAVPFAGPVNRVVNLGIYGGAQYPTAGLPLDIRLTPDKNEIGPGETISFTVSITNIMPNDIHQVFVTDMFPAELQPTAIETSVGSAWIGDQVAIAELGDLAQGEGAVVRITAVADPNLDEGDVVVNRAGAFYKESVAMQAEVRLNDEIVAPQSLPETGNALVAPLIAALVLMGAIVVLRRLRLSQAV